MPFKPGAEWRGNSSGRPKKTEGQIRFERQCREWAELFALDHLKRAAKSEKPQEIIAAVREICDRGFGKAEAISYLEANVNPAIGSSPEDAAREIEDLLAQGTGTLPGGGGPDKVDTGK